jgi:asparagine synthase (glutamine-hydrolysing)
MCGICGILKRQGVTNEDLACVEHMNSALTHRGPDDEGRYSSRELAMAMRRLSIIDLEGARQPLYSEDRRLVLIANGEIYNYRELRRDLVRQGHCFSTHGDCEVILHLYERYGEGCVDHLRGMFAFALWDSVARKLLLARDRMGEKPLYLCRTRDSLLFASELRALMQSAHVAFELDPVGVDLFLHYEYVPEPRTMVKGVEKLDAAQVLVIDWQSWNFRKFTYWDKEAASPIPGNGADALRAELESVSELVVRSDVPVGVALSGGLDSSAVAALAGQKVATDLHAFTVGYPGRPASDERQDARKLADQLQMPFHEVELSTPDFVRSFEDVVISRDDPIADIAGYGYYAVSRLARENGVPVLLQGQGGDELFWGYPEVRQALRETEIKDGILSGRVGAWLQCMKLSSPAGWRPWQLRKWVGDCAGVRSGLQSGFRYRREDPRRMIFEDVNVHFKGVRHLMRHVYTPDFLQQLAGHTPFDIFSFDRPWPRADIRMTSLICDTYLRENGVAQADRLSMASSIEMRLPLLDYRLVETVVGLRKRARDDRLPPKARMRAAVGDLLPRAVLQRPKKGFTPPVREWQSTLIERYRDDVLSGYLVQNGFLQEKTLNWLMAPPAFDSWSTVAFAVIVLDLWCRQMAGMLSYGRGGGQ